MAILSRAVFELAEQRSFGLPYPVYVNNLKEIGVQSYRVDVRNHDRRIFSGVHQGCLEIPGSDMLLVPVEPFDLVALKLALHRTQSGLSNYPTFMQEIAAAGVHFYTADLLNRTVTYFGKSPSDLYEEAISHPGDV